MEPKILSSRSIGRFFKNKPTGLIKVQQIVQVKKEALRRGLWYRALNRVERSVLDLTAKYFDCIRSTKLATIVTAIIEKLKTASEGLLDRLARTVGFSLAQKVSNLAIRWGNHLANGWVTDTAFARYLALTHMNSMQAPTA